MSKIAGFWKSLKIQIAWFWKSFQISVERNINFSVEKILPGKIKFFCNQSTQEVDFINRSLSVRVRGAWGFCFLLDTSQNTVTRKLSSS